jgi:RNA polymerase sigma-70 factor (ECF subfamily)
VEEGLSHRGTVLPGDQVEAFIPPLPLQPVGDDDPMAERGGHCGGLLGAEQAHVHRFTLTQEPPPSPSSGTGVPICAYVGEMDDEALLDRCRRGDRGAFTPLVHRYQDELYTMALRLTGNPADAADVVQETFTRAFRSLPRLRGATVRAWLFRVAVNCSHDIHRQRSRRPADPLEDTEGRVIDLPDPGLGPEATAIQRERADAVRVALLALPHDFRVAVVLRDVNQLSYEEMAEALSVPLGTVKSRISRARGLLAAALRQSSAVFPSAEEAW